MKIVKCACIVVGFGLLAGSALVHAQVPPVAPTTPAPAQTAPANPTRVRANLDRFDLSPQSGKSANQTGAASRAPVPPQAPPAKPATRVRAKLDGFDLSPQAGKSANQIGGASRDLGSPRLYAPHAGKAFTVMPVFYWGTAEAGQKVTFRLTALNGQTLYEVSTTDNHVTYPHDATSLTVGTTYRWTVLPENDMLGGPPAPALITIVAGDDRAAIEKELGKTSDPNAVFVKYRIWYDAVAGYTSILDQQPDNQDALKGRAAVYDQVTATQDLAHADWSRVH